MRFRFNIKALFTKKGKTLGAHAYLKLIEGVPFIFADDGYVAGFFQGERDGTDEFPPAASEHGITLPGDLIAENDGGPIDVKGGPPIAALRIKRGDTVTTYGFTPRSAPSPRNVQDVLGRILARPLIARVGANMPLLEKAAKALGDENVILELRGETGGMGDPPYIVLVPDKYRHEPMPQAACVVMPRRHTEKLPEHYAVPVGSASVEPEVSRAWEAEANKTLQRDLDLANEELAVLKRDSAAEIRELNRVLAVAREDGARASIEIRELLKAADIAKNGLTEARRMFDTQTKEVGELKDRLAIAREASKRAEGVAKEAEAARRETFEKYDAQSRQVHVLTEKLSEAKAAKRDETPFVQFYAAMKAIATNAKRPELDLLPNELRDVAERMEGIATTCIRRGNDLVELRSKLARISELTR